MSHRIWRAFGLLLLALAVLAPSSAVQAQSREDLQEQLEALLEQLEELQQQLEEQLEEENGSSDSEEEEAEDALDDALDALDDAREDVEDANDDGKDTEEAEDLLDDAEDLLDDADEELDDEDYDDVMDLVDDAQDLIDEALQEIETDSADAADALDEASDALDDAWNEVEEADDDGIDTDDAEDLLDDAEDEIDDGWDEYNDEDFDEAIEQAERAQDLIDQALEALEVEATASITSLRYEAMVMSMSGKATTPSVRITVEKKGGSILYDATTPVHAEDVWFHNVQESFAAGNYVVRVYSPAGEELAKKSIKIGTATDTYRGYSNGKLFIETKNITEAAALANCKLNAGNNRSAIIRCTWGTKEIFRRDPNSVEARNAARMAIAIGVYEGSYPNGKPKAHAEGRVTVNVKAEAWEYGQPLVLTAYEPVLWVINNPNGAEITKVITVGYYNQRVAGLPAGVPVEHHSFVKDGVYQNAYAYKGKGYDSLTKWIGNIVGYSGVFVGKYSASSLNISWGYKG